MSQDSELTQLDRLVQDELDGKAAAIAGYDQFLWKIRTGFATILYGSIGLIVTLVEANSLVVGYPVMFSIAALIIGFSVTGALMDVSFMESKLRVVTARDELTKHALERATQDQWVANNELLLDCLHNAGERSTSVDWDRWTGRRRPLYFYGGTCVACLTAIVCLAV